MVHISDYEDKKMTVAYFLARRHNDRHSISSIYRCWCQWWKDDFKIGEGFYPEIHENRLVLSIKDAQIGEAQSEVIEDYNEILLDVQKYLIDNFNRKISRKENSNNLKAKKLRYERKKCRELIDIFCKSGIDKTGRYRIWNKTSKKYPCKLGLYAIHDSLVKDRNKHVFIGTFDEVVDYINKRKKRPS